MSNKIEKQIYFGSKDELWEKSRIKDISSIISGNELADPGDIPVMTISASYGFIDQQKRFGKVIAANSITKYTHLKRGEFSYNRGNSKLATYGCIFSLSEKEALVPNVYHSFKLFENFSSGYFHYYFGSRVLDKQLRTYVSSSARMDGLLNISKSDFFNSKVSYPSQLKTQEKYGSYLSSIDNLVEKQSDNISSISSIKNYYINKHFTAYKDFPRCFKLGKIIKHHDDRTLVENQYTQITSSKKGIFTQEEYFNSEVLKKTNIGSKIVPYGYFTYRSMSDTGDFTFNVQQRFELAMITSAYPVFNSKIDSSYLLLALNHSPEIKKQIRIMQEGATRSSLSFTKLEKFDISLPCEDKIRSFTAFVSQMDKLIEIEEKKLEQLEKMKKYHLQQFFN